MEHKHKQSITAATVADCGKKKIFCERREKDMPMEVLKWTKELTLNRSSRLIEAKASTDISQYMHL